MSNTGFQWHQYRAVLEGCNPFFSLRKKDDHLISKMCLIGVCYGFSCYGCGEVFTLKEKTWGKERLSKIPVDFWKSRMRLLLVTALLEMLDNIVKKKIKFCALGYKLIKKKKDFFAMHSCLVKYSKCKCTYMWVSVIFPSLETLVSGNVRVDQHHPHPMSPGTGAALI